jgi:threonine dehydratase
VGGGGLAAGVATAVRALDPGIALHGAEPTGAADAHASLQAGERRVDVIPDTICDGLRATIGVPNFTILAAVGLVVTTVTDEEAIAAMRLLWSHLRIVVEVSSATVLAAVLKQPALFRGRHVGLVLTGGNVDLDALPWA